MIILGMSNFWEYLVFQTIVAVIATLIILILCTGVCCCISRCIGDLDQQDSDSDSDSDDDERGNEKGRGATKGTGGKTGNRDQQKGKKSTLAGNNKTKTSACTCTQWDIFSRNSNNVNSATGMANPLTPITISFKNETEPVKPAAAQ